VGGEANWTFGVLPSPSETCHSFGSAKRQSWGPSLDGPLLRTVHLRGVDRWIAAIKLKRTSPMAYDSLAAIPRALATA